MTGKASINLLQGIRRRSIRRLPSPKDVWNYYSRDKSCHEPWPVQPCILSKDIISHLAWCSGVRDSFCHYYWRSSEYCNGGQWSMQRMMWSIWLVGTIYLMGVEETLGSLFEVKQCSMVIMGNASLTIFLYPLNLRHDSHQWLDNSAFYVGSRSEDCRATCNHRVDFQDRWFTCRWRRKLLQLGLEKDIHIDKRGKHGEGTLGRGGLSPITLVHQHDGDWTCHYSCSSISNMVGPRELTFLLKHESPNPGPTCHFLTTLDYDFAPIRYMLFRQESKASWAPATRVQHHLLSSMRWSFPPLPSIHSARPRLCISRNWGGRELEQMK